ncbi:hypothetical protein IWZ01DRAFT_562125 [Phyllosticta capitalensis]
MCGKVVRFGDRGSLRQVSEVWEYYSWTMSSDVSRFDEVKKRSQRIALRSSQGAFEENQHARSHLAEVESLRQSMSLLLAASNVSEEGYAELCSSEEKARCAWVKMAATAASPQSRNASEEKAHYAWRKMAATAAFSVFDHGHQDLVLAVDLSFFGTRIVTACWTERRR